MNELCLSAKGIAGVVRLTGSFSLNFILSSGLIAWFRPRASEYDGLFVRTPRGQVKGDAAITQAIYIYIRNASYRFVQIVS